MGYLFFDIECANCYDDKGKICEFGYVLTDDNFNIIDEKEFIINPNADFDWYVINKMLAYPKELYLEKPLYPQFFDTINHLFLNSQIIIVGHSVDRDAHYLNCESERYDLPFINYRFYDAKKIFSDCFNMTKNLKLNEICEFFNVKSGKHQHRAMDDAVSTMEITKAMCNKLDINLKQLINSSKNCAGYTSFGEIHTVEMDRNNMIRNAKEKIGICTSSSDLKRFVKSVIPSGKVIKSSINGKTLTIDNNYQKNNVVEMGIIVQSLKDRGCDYSFIVAESDIVAYIKTDDTEEKPNGKLKQAEKEKKKGKDIELITMEQLFSILDIKESELIKTAEIRKNQWEKEKIEIESKEITY